MEAPPRNIPVAQVWRNEWVVMVTGNPARFRFWHIMYHNMFG
jgi:hypothetical protein